MRLAGIIISLTLLAQTQINAQHSPKAESLLDWTSAITRPGFELLHASRQKGMFFAVFRTEDGRLAFCSADKRPDLERVQSITAIQRKEGMDLIAHGKGNQEPLVREVAMNRNGNRLMLKHHDGDIYRLIENIPDEVRIIHKVSALTGQEYETVFDELVSYREPH